MLAHKSYKCLNLVRPYSTLPSRSNEGNKSGLYGIIAGILLGGSAVAFYKNRVGGHNDLSQSGSRATPNHSISADTPGGPLSLKTSALCLGGDLSQNFGPINSIHLSVCGLHHYAGDKNRQVEAHHFCSHLNEDVHQCVIYDSSQPDARLIGVEYIISREIFEQLPEEEKKLWHSHSFEVKSGMLVSPGVPEIAEDTLMDHLLNTYGKTFHTWQIDRGDKLPLGLPQLMMSFTDDSEIDYQLLERRDKELNVSYKDKRARRAGLKDEPVAAGADYYHTHKPDFYKE